MHLDLTDAEAEVLAQELAGIVEGARYPLSPRISALRSVPGKLRPETVGALADAEGLRAAVEGEMAASPPVKLNGTRSQAP